MKETTKRHSKEDQGSPSEKKNIKCQDKGHQNIFENNLTESNECYKGCQMYKKTHILDVFTCFKDPAEAMRTLNISWNELSEAEGSHLETMVKEKVLRMFAFTFI